MAIASKILGSRGKKPAAGVSTLAYTVPASTQAQGRISICNQGSLIDSIRLAITPSGQTLATTDYIFYDTPLPAKTTIGDIKFELATGDFITIYSLLGQCSFIITGLEVS